MKLSHTLRATSAVFDDPSLVSSAGLVLVVALAESAGLPDLPDSDLTVPKDKGANRGLKVASLVAGMVAGADSHRSTPAEVRRLRARSGPPVPDTGCRGDALSPKP
jgi:hypothetical protein